MAKTKIDTTPTLVNTFKKFKDFNMLMSYYSSIYYIDSSGLVPCKSLLHGVEYVGKITNPDLLLYSKSIILPNKLRTAISKVKVGDLTIDRLPDKITIKGIDNFYYEIPQNPNNAIDCNEFYTVFHNVFRDLDILDFKRVPANIVEDLADSKLAIYDEDNNYLRLTKQLFPRITAESELYICQAVNIYKNPEESPKKLYVFKLSLNNLDMYTLCAAILTNHD